jgi:TetR/AcrR family transcriptional regulator, transcriptional repressor of bet genes
MNAARRTFRREGEEARRAALISAALDCIAQGGPQSATTRAMADRAGVTPGLIRHYFATKEDLISAAFEALMTRLTEDSSDRLADEPGTARAHPVARLRSFVEAALSPPVVDKRALALWAGFMQMVPRDAGMRAVHHRTYLGFRDRLEGLIGDALAARGIGSDAASRRSHAIACNAVLDGLWLEGGALPDAFAPDELPRIGIASVGAILGLDLTTKECAR